ncbi:hypothetical protein [Fundicoccus ignavus]|uniref:Uncharacterized protein n=1 Tax=Fundicoccus ignavus TaxID=2664442 RepID=A0A844CHB9_9LACT|nr:hypothetical protein [Fundicoccus ignavus]MRJ47105.1 hypothetical protein [Fundicoccus ignavus]
MKRSIRNINSLEQVPERLFDAMVNSDGDIVAEFKLSKSKKVVVPWNEIVYQIESMKRQQIK